MKNLRKNPIIVAVIIIAMIITSQSCSNEPVTTKRISFKASVMDSSKNPVDILLNVSINYYPNPKNLNEVYTSSSAPVLEDQNGKFSGIILENKKQETCLKSLFQNEIDNKNIGFEIRKGYNKLIVTKNFKDSFLPEDLEETPFNFEFFEGSKLTKKISAKNVPEEFQELIKGTLDELKKGI